MFKKKDKKQNSQDFPQNNVELSAAENSENAEPETYETLDDADKLTKDILEGKIAENEDNSATSSAGQNEKNEKLEGIKDKISQILRVQGIEIVDENEGDEFDEAQSDQKSQQDYDELKSIFGDDGKNKNKQLTLTVDDFDYTYVGQYVDEFDLLHVRSIKHIKMPKKFPKPLKRAIIAASILLVVGIGVFFAYWFTRDIPVYITSVKLSQDSGYYFTGQNFSYNELYLVVDYSNGNREYVELEPEHYASGRGNASIIDTNPNSIVFNQIGDVTLSFNYSGFVVDYRVSVNSFEDTGINAIVVPTIFENPPTHFNNDNMCVMLVRSGLIGNSEYVEVQNKFNLLSSSSIIGIDIINGTVVSHCTFESGNGYRINATLNYSSKIEIKYHNENDDFSIILGRDTNGNVIILDE